MQYAANRMLHPCMQDAARPGEPCNFRRGGREGQAARCRPDLVYSQSECKSTCMHSAGAAAGAFHKRIVPGSARLVWLFHSVPVDELVRFGMVACHGQLAETTCPVLEHVNTSRSYARRKHRVLKLHVADKPCSTAVN